MKLSGEAERLAEIPFASHTRYRAIALLLLLLGFISIGLQMARKCKINGETLTYHSFIPFAMPS